MDIYTESSGIDTSPDMNSSSDLPEDFSSPDRMAMLKPRTLTYDESDDIPAMQRPNDIFSQHNNNNNNNIGVGNKLLDDEDDNVLHRMHLNRNHMNIRTSIRPTSLVQASKLNLESPPYRKVRALRLFDTPATPKTIIQKSSASELLPTTATVKFGTKPGGSCETIPATPMMIDRPKAYPIHNKVLDSISANINPFSPSNSKF